MTQKNELLTREDNGISLVSARRTITQEDHPIITERELPVNMTDTAGLRDTEDRLEKLGVERSKSAIDRADILLIVVDGSADLKNEDIILFSKIN
jgi:tRNA U34 5-carboxymethylaminomethyl modifying GTPase MnmE/TrmE